MTKRLNRRGRVQKQIALFTMVLVVATFTLAWSGGLLTGTAQPDAETGTDRPSSDPGGALADSTNIEPTSPAQNGAAPGVDLPDESIDASEGQSSSGAPITPPRDAQAPSPDAPSAGVALESIEWTSGGVESLDSGRAAKPAAVRIPSLGVDATVEAVSVDQDGEMIIPDDDNHVGWYQHGPAPGEPGSAVIAGHLDDYEGRSVFFELADIELGSLVEVRSSDGQLSMFEVTDKTSFPADQLPAEELFARDGDPRLALLTCGGDWDHSKNRYEETVVVYATPVT